ncbi:putative carboxylesterase [Mollisia scopiformis]|uniref:Carboxylic ester hydrolase n=1 Tax=Mollisia scopiformis TaxID=149040 RepID=A0A132BBH7_MOLSC|nr:putative carboxylesterase [Mollisia scopiformis]KUJ09746.1 putative carboxylesterase [Mollisia scopiformis]
MATFDVEITLPTQTAPSYDQLVVGKKSPLTSDLEEFRGIPFGFVPGRWRHSELRVSLPSDKYDATRNGPKCPQSPEPNNSETFQSHVDFPSDVTESEFECLNLFIIRPSKEALSRFGKENENLPVLIWIHGGAFGFGAGTDPMWDPSRLILESLALGTPFIAVNLNYRLNLFGFAASSELLDDQTGGARKGCNFGLRDQQIGIQWISKNIGYFGGDSTKITLSGQSAGAASTHTHTLSAKQHPEAPLFRRSIFQSGSLGCLGPSPLSHANENWDTLCQHLGFEKDDRVSRLEKLRTLPPEELLRAQKELGWMAFQVIIDGASFTATDGECEVFIDLDGGRGAYDISKTSGEAIEILIGDTDVEASIFASQIYKINNFEQAQALFKAEFPTPSAAEDILNAYGISCKTPLDTVHRQLFRFVGDVMFGLPLFKARNFFTTKQEKSETTGDIEEPRFYHPTQVQSYKVKFGNPFLGPSHDVSHHCVELIYLFDAFHDDLVKIDHIEHATADQLTPPLSSSSSSASLNRIDDSISPNTAPEPATQPTTRKKRPNIALKKDIQRHWIQFITKEESSIVEDEITVYNTDREIYTESLSGDNEWIEEAKRFEMLARYPEANRKVLKRLTQKLLI